MLCEESHFSYMASIAISQHMSFHWHSGCGAVIAQSLRAPYSSKLCTDLTPIAAYIVCERDLASMLPWLRGQQVLHSEGNSKSITTVSDEAWKWGDPPWLWSPGYTSPEVQNSSISGHTKTNINILQKYFQKKYPVIPIKRCDRNRNITWSERK